MLKNFLNLLLMTAITLSTAAAQEIPAAVIEKEHVWLKQFVGEWDCVSKSVASDVMPAMECTGVMKCTMLGELWVVNNIENKMQGTDVKALQTIGYDSSKKRFVGTWIDSLMNHQWQYVGSIDETEKVLTLEAEGPNFVEEGKTAKFRDVYEFKSADLIVATSSMQSSDGSWITFMNGEFKRKK